MNEKEARLESMELEKERMIRAYLALQDQADAMNEKIYRTCCDVETLNVQINALKEEIRRAGGPKPKPANGSSTPANQPSSEKSR